MVDKIDIVTVVEQTVSHVLRTNLKALQKGSLYRSVIKQAEIGVIKALLMHTRGSIHKSSKLASISEPKFRERVHSYGLYYLCKGYSTQYDYMRSEASLEELKQEDIRLYGVTQRTGEYTKKWTKSYRENVLSFLRQDFRDLGIDVSDKVWFKEYRNMPQPELVQERKKMKTLKKELKLNLN